MRRLFVVAAGVSPDLKYPPLQEDATLMVVFSVQAGLETRLYRKKAMRVCQQ